MLNLKSARPWLLICLLSALAAPGVAQDEPIRVTIKSNRATIFSFQTIELTLSVENLGSKASAILQRENLLGPHNFLCAPAAMLAQDREGSWAQLQGKPARGALGPLLPGETFTSQVELKLPPSLTQSQGPVALQWIGSLGGRELRSAEIQVNIRQGEHPVASVQTTEGQFFVELWQKKAPNHVANFIHLARANFYDGLPFHMVWPNFSIQTGSPDGSPAGDAGYTIPAEFNDTPFRKGVIGMATVQGDPDSASSQWFVCVADALTLNGKYTAFGRILEGQDVLDRISRVPTDGKGHPQKPVRIRRLWVGTPKSYVLPQIIKTGEQKGADGKDEGKKDGGKKAGEKKKDGR